MGSPRATSEEKTYADNLLHKTQPTFLDEATLPEVGRVTSASEVGWGLVEQVVGICFSWEVARGDSIGAGAPGELCEAKLPDSPKPGKS